MRTWENTWVILLLRIENYIIIVRAIVKYIWIYYVLIIFFKSTDRYRSDLYISIDSVNFLYKIFFFSLEKVKHEGIDNSLDEFFIQYHIYIYVYTTFVHITMGQKNILKRFIFIICFIFIFCSRWRSSTVIRRHPQFSFQIRPTLGPPLNFFGKTRLGPIFLQSRPKRGVRAHAQEPAGFHHYEPNRSQFGTSDSCGKTSCIVHFF